MKTKIKKDFDAVRFMRQSRDKISMEIADLDFDQIKAYHRSRRPKTRNSVVGYPVPERSRRVGKWRAFLH